MDKPLRLTLIDATGRGAFERIGDAKPPVVEILLSLDEDKTADQAPPVIVCAEADTALARGAFVVSGDGDGVVIGLDPLGRQAARLALLAAFAGRHAPGAEYVYRDGASGAALSFDGEPVPVQFDPTERRGILVPRAQNWAALRVRMETDG